MTIHVGEIEVSGLADLLNARDRLRNPDVALAFCRRRPPSYTQAVERWLLGGGEVWLIGAKGTPSALSDSVRRTLVDAKVPGADNIDGLVSDVHAQIELMARYLDAGEVTVSLYSRSMFLGIDFFREMKRATPHTDSHARLVSALIGDGTAYVPRSFFDPEGIATFHAKWDQFVVDYDNASTKEGRWAALERLQRLIACPDFAATGLPARLPAHSVGIFDVRGKERREEHFWHWIPYTAEHRLLLNVDPLEID